MPSEDELAFYASHSAMSDPGRHAGLLDGAPGDERALARWVRNVQFHEIYAAEAKLALPADAMADPATCDSAVRGLEPMLTRILSRDPRPLSAARDKADSFICTCRDYALLFCALLRHQGRPARLRCGFAGYYDPDGPFAADHWVTEVWDREAGCWRLVDSEVDPDLPQHRVITLDPFDVPRDQFKVAARAWQELRSGQAEPDAFGVLGDGAKGAWFVAADVVRDVAALNKDEMTVFDYWGLSTEICRTGRVSEEQARLIDHLALLSADETFDFAGLRQVYRQRAEIRVSDPVKAWPRGIETDFALASG